MKAIFFILTSLLIGRFCYSSLDEAQAVTIFGHKPEHVVILENQVYVSKLGFMVNRNNRNQVTSFLAVKPVAKNSYQYAFFMDKNAFFQQRSIYTIDKFDLLKNSNGTYSVRCNFGATSYLAVKPVGENNYEYAFFATKEYLNSDKSFIYEFQITKCNDSYLISFKKQFNAYLAIDLVSAGSYQWAFFADGDYIRNYNQKGSFTFDIHTKITSQDF